MPRNNAPAASTLRNRNRITNKTRLKIHQGSLDADAVLIPDEDEEKHRLTNLVAGVDAEDANEHHLQEVLSASHRTSVASRLSNRVVQPPPAAYIPTPDSTGIVPNYDELYPPDHWKDPVTYVCTSQTVEESIANGIAGGFTYYMDERDKEWLDKNNEEARGEGTSAQGALSTSGTRTSARSAKAKGKEPESSLPVVISEDEFELVMGIFEKVTHERTEFLHHGLENGMDFPPFLEYQDVFSAALPTSVFANYSIPSWIPTPAALSRTAKTIYPYWKERRIERGGHRIIPILNADESDTLNESYVCFRRRESKSVRKTRASQVTSSDKLARLQMEFHYPLEIAKLILSRETVKKEVAQQAQIVWEKRLAFADLKRKFPTLNDKLDEELLVDKDRPVKKPDTRLKIKTSDANRSEPVIRPKDRIALIREQVETTLERQKAIDHHWEDLVDNPYQPPLVPYSSKLFKFVPPPDAPVWPSSNSDKTEDDSPSPRRQPRAVRMRYGRGGRVFLDRRNPAPQRFSKRLPRSSLFALDEKDETEAALSDDAEEAERRKTLEERWKFDVDDTPPIGPEGVEEHDRQLVDDYDASFLRHAMTLHTESDHIHLVTDPTLVIFSSEGRPQGIVPYRLGVPPIIMRRDAQGVVRPFPGMVQHMLALQNGNSLAIPQHLKKMQPAAAAQMRISSGGGMRPPAISTTNSQSSPSQPQPMQSQSNAASPTNNHSPPHSPVPVPQHSPPNGVGRPAISMPHVEVAKTDASTVSNGIPPNGFTATSQPEPNGDAANAGTPSRPKSQNVNPQPHAGIPPNGYHLPLTNMSAALLNSNYLPQNGQHAGGLSLQQVQNLKSAFANLSATEMAALNGGRPLPASYLMPNMQLPANLKLPNSRQTQWAMAQLQQRPAPAVNGIDGQLSGGVTNGMVAVSPSLSQSVPVRSPSANGQRTGLRNGVHVNGQHSLSPHLQPSPTLPNISQSQSPPRISLASSMGLPSPSLQQPIGSNQNGY